MITQFARPTDLKEALTELQKGESSHFLGGGTEILRLKGSVKPQKVVSLRELKLDSITKEDRVVTLGSAVTFQKAIDSDLVPTYLKEALLFCGSRTRRNMATIGGNISLNRDDSFLLPTLIAAKARLILSDLASDNSYSEEDIPIREYHSFYDHFGKSLIKEIVLNKPTRFVASLRFAKTVQSHAAVTLSFGADISSKEIKDVRIAAAIKGSGVVRLIEVEEGISSGQFQKPEDAATLAASGIAFVDDITGSANYKRYMVGTATVELYRLCLEAIAQGGKL